MYNKKGFTLIELLVVIAIIALLLSIIMPALKKTKEQMKALACRTNLRSFSTAMALYAQDHNDKLFPHDASTVFITWVAPYMSDLDKIRYCPSAMPLKQYLDSTSSEIPSDISPKGTADRAWWWSVVSNQVVEWGSYAINGFLYNPAEQIWGNPAEWHPSKDYWPDAWFEAYSDASQPGEVPTFCDGVWPDTWPDGDDYPPITEGGLFEGSTGWYPYFMQRVCVDRHDMAINVAFLDGHAEKIPLEKLWTLQWHKLFVRAFDIQMPR